VVWPTWHLAAHRAGGGCIDTVAGDASHGETRPTVSASGSRKRVLVKKLIWATIILGLLVGCAYVTLTLAIWFVPPQPATRAMALADLDGDQDLDAFLANGRNESSEPNTVLLNDGRGVFHDSGQKIGEAESWAVLLHDFDGDGDVDALVSNVSGGEYFRNVGSGDFPYSRRIAPPEVEGYLVGLWRFNPADLNGDGFIDLFLVGCCGGGVSTGPDDWRTLNAHNSVWLGTGEGLPQGIGQEFGSGSSQAADLADLDGDGDLDAFVANSFHIGQDGGTVNRDANEVWLNDGRGTFVDSGQKLGSQDSYSIALGDLDGDGDIDAFVGNRGPDEVWWNDGHAGFVDSGQVLGDTLTRFLYLADLDGDGDLDAVHGDDRQGRIWLNDGRGAFTDSGQQLPYSQHHAVTVGDVDGMARSMS